MWLIVVAVGRVQGNASCPLRWASSPGLPGPSGKRDGAPTADSSTAHGEHCARTSVIDYQRPSRHFRTVVASALLAWGVAGILASQSQTVISRQTVTTTGSPSGAEFYLKRGEDFSSVRDYDRAIADYNTAIRVKPDYAEAYNDRGFAYCLKGDAERAIAITPGRLHCGPTIRKRTTAAALCTWRMVTRGRRRSRTSITPSR